MMVYYFALLQAQSQLCSGGLHWKCRWPM